MVDLVLLSVVTIFFAGFFIAGRVSLMSRVLSVVLRVFVFGIKVGLKGFI
jgi:hypothetical protein